MENGITNDEANSIGKFIEDFENYKESLYCQECGRDDNFTYSRTTSNAEVWWCGHCKIEHVKSNKPNEDNY